MKKSFFFLLLISCFGFSPKAQTNVDTPNLSFGDGSLNVWKIYTGEYYFDKVVASPTYGLYTYKWTQVATTPRINIISNNSSTYDPVIACNLLTNPNNKSVVRIGSPTVCESWKGGSPYIKYSAAEKIEYTFKVTKNTTLLSYKLAAILHVPAGDNHLGDQRPSYTLDVTIVDSLGVSYSIPCTAYSSKAASGGGLIQNSNCLSSIAGTARLEYVYQPWISGNVDLSAQIGKTATITVKTHDCLLNTGSLTDVAGGHSVHGYFWAETKKIELTTFSCENSDATIVAPQGFSSYSWTRSDGKPITIPDATQPWIISVDKSLNLEGIIYSCALNDATSSCGAITVSTVIIPVKLYPDFTSKAIDAGKIKFTSTSTSDGDSITNYYWDFGDGVGYSNLQNPTYTYSAFIPFNVKLTVTSSKGCSKTISYNVLPTKELTAKIFPPANLVYNGQTKDFTDSVSIAGLLRNVDYYIRYKNLPGTPYYNSYVAPVNVGDYNATFELSYLSLLKYFVTSVPTEDFTITKAPLTVTITDVSKTYGETIMLLRQGFTQSMNPLYAGDKIYELELKCNGLKDTTSVGVYTILADSAIGLGVKNYDISFVNGSLTVLPKVLNISALNNTKIYGSQFVPKGNEFYIAPTSLVGEDSVISVTLTSPGFDTTAIVGAYPILASNALGYRLSNYTLTYKTGNLIVNKKNITITARKLNKVYGSVYAFSGDEYDTDLSQLVDTDSILQLQFTSLGTALKATVGDYGLSILGVTGYRLENYDITLVNNILKVTPMPVTIVANDKSKEYSDLHSFAGTEFSTDKPLLTGDTILVVSLVSDGNTKTALIGTYDIYASQAFGAGMSNYDFTYSKGTLSVVKKTLVAAIFPPAFLGYNPQPKEFTATVSVSNLVLNSDYFIRYTNKTGSSTPPYNSTTAPTEVGDYTATFELSNASLLKYKLDVAPTQDFTITKAPLTITPDDAMKTYGDSINSDMLKFSFKTNMKPLFGTDRIDALSLECVGFTDTAAVGVYSILADSAIGSGIKNYNIQFNAGHLTIKPKALSIKALDASKVYGDSISNPTGDEFYVDVHSLVGNDSVSTVDFHSAGYAVTAAAGTYSIKASNAAGLGMKNYQITYADANFQVFKKKIFVSAKSFSKVYGSDYVFNGSEFEALSTQFVGNDKITGVTLNSSGAQAKVSVGQYSASLTSVIGDGMNNYDIVFQNGILNVTPKPIVVIAKDLEKEYGDFLSFTGNEFTTDVPLYGTDSLSFAFLKSSGAVESAPIATYDIIPSNASGAGSLNYSISYRAGKLSVIQKQLFVTALSYEKSYGEKDTEKRILVVDKRGVEYSPALLSGNVVRVPGENVGSYSITKGTLSTSSSYSFAFTDGLFTVNKALPKIDAFFKNEAGQYVFADVLGNDYGDNPQGSLNIKIKQANIDKTVTVTDGTCKFLVPQLPNQMVEAEFSYLGDDNYLPVTMTMKIYAVVYHSNGGSIKAVVSNFDGSESVKLETPSHDGNYKFDGWYETEDFSGTEIRRIPIGINQDVHLYAKWSLTYDDLSIVVLFNQVLAVANPLNRDFIYTATYKWYKDSVQLPSVKQYCGFENYVPSGFYKVEIYYSINAPIVLYLNHQATIPKSKVYSNPMHKNSTLFLDTELVRQEGVSIEVYNLSGARQTSITVRRDSDRFIINGLEDSGTYILQLIKDGSIVETHKVIVEE